MYLEVAGFGVKVAGLGLIVADFGVKVAGLGLVVADFGVQMAGLGLVVADFGVKVAGLGLVVADFGCGGFEGREAGVVAGVWVVVDMGLVEVVLGVTVGLVEPGWHGGVGGGQRLLGGAERKWCVGLAGLGLEAAGLMCGRSKCIGGLSVGPEGGL